MRLRRNKRNHSRQTKMRHLIAKQSPRSPITEQYRTIRTNLQFASVDEELNSLLVTSATSGDGKSLTAANLAIVYAQQGKKVLLIDADLRKPTVHYTFRIDNLAGLCNILIGEHTLEQAVQESEVENLDIISSGPIPPNPAELLGSQRMQDLVKDAQTHYDMIVFDSPPVLAVTDAQILANLVNGAILVIRSGETEYEEVEKAKEALERTSTKLLGSVLNDKEKKKNDYYYYYGS